MVEFNIHFSDLPFQFNRNPPIEVAGYTPDIPKRLPLTRVYSDGDEGISNDWRVREQWSPSSAWAGMTTTLSPVCRDAAFSWYIRSPKSELFVSTAFDVIAKHQVSGRHRTSHPSAYATH